MSDERATLYRICELLMLPCGIQLKSQNRLANFRLACSFLLFGAMATLSLLEVLLSYTNIESIGKAEIFPVYFKNILMIINYLFTKEQWWKVTLDIEQKFWKPQHYDHTLRKHQAGIIAGVISIVKYYLGSMMTVTALFYYVKPGFFGQLPVIIYTPCDLPRDQACYWTAYFAVSAVTSFNVCFVMGYDVLLVYQTACVYAEIEAINCRLGKIDCLDGENTDREVYELIEHHGVVLDVVRQMRKIWSGNLLMLYWMSTISICLGFFLLTINGMPSLDEISKYGSFISAFATELLVYCIAGTVLMEKSTSVSKAAFEVNWWVKTQPNIRKALSMMIQRANKPGMLDVGGVSPMTLVMFPQILKTSFSFYTLMQNLGEEVTPATEG